MLSAMVSEDEVSKKEEDSMSKPGTAPKRL